ncbi:hypothetical protein KFK09_004916 [Dendrobium nobile]|uniref:Uncharacterized protein n=1 Tax=Dendrobium nobile TaxID=94219 RepID=A0A8T3BZU1_DENNO|nr:hypothetical protein KFK09_004916 [Dendrobium nobile]
MALSVCQSDVIWSFSRPDFLEMHVVLKFMSLTRMIQIEQVSGNGSSIQSFMHIRLVDNEIHLVQPKALCELWDVFFGLLLRALADLLKKGSFNPCFALYGFVEGFAGSGFK